MNDHEPQQVSPWPNPEIDTFDSERLMLPPWLKYPNIPIHSIGWKMGVGEVYLEDYAIWWSRQPRAIRIKTK
jgi:hypothetical protein